VRLFAGLGLRFRLALALVGLTVFAVGLATVVSNRGIQPRLTDAARARAERSAEQLAIIAAHGYKHDSGWTKAQTGSLDLLASINGLDLTILDANGHVVTIPNDPAEREGGQPVAERPVTVSGRRVGSIRVSANGHLLTREDVSLRNSLDSLLLLAGAISVGAALFCAFVLAHTLSTPLRRARLAAEGIARGELSSRVSPEGGAELQALGQAINRLAETLQDEERLRKAGVADLAHELRTPVGGILGRIEAAQDSVLHDQEANLGAMHAEAIRLTRLLDDLSQLADAERPGLMLDTYPVNLATCAAQQAASFQPQFEQKGVSLVTDLLPAWIDGDRGRITQIIANLLSNAARYTSTGEVCLETAMEDGWSTVAVTDTGSGIAAEDVPHIFKRFWRAEKSRSRATGGAGIGLAIVRELVDAHEGSIDVQTTPGGGSRFVVRIAAIEPPVESDLATPSAPPASAAATDRSRSH
jgi:signal transduction histidine kinase